MKTQGTIKESWPHLLGRRDFLRVGALSYLGLGLSEYFQLSSLMPSETRKKAPAQSCILIWMHGGQSHLDTWDVKGNSGFRPISTNVPGIQISELLPRVSKHMDKLSIIRSMKNESNGHFEGRYYALTGHLPSTKMSFPSVSSIIAKELDTLTDIPAYVTTSQDQLNCRAAGFVAPQFEPLSIPAPRKKAFKGADLTLPGEIPVEALQARRSFLDLMDERYRQLQRTAELVTVDAFDERALNLITSSAVTRAFDLSQESIKTKEAYGPGRFGQGTLLARRLVEAGCRFVTIDGWNKETNQDWDTHYRNNYYLKEELVPPLDRALSTLLVDLDERGLFDSTIVLVMGEFGRTPHINSGRGRDHWGHCWSLVLGGGGVKGGQIVGASDEKGAYVAERLITIGDLFATIYRALGINWTKTYTGSGCNPIHIANSIGDKQGKPVHELV